MTIGLVTVAYGDKFQNLLPTWAESVSRLNTKPDLITIVGDHLPSDVREKLDSLITYTWLKAKIKPKTHAQILLNQAIKKTDTTWIVKLDADDEIFPHALDALANCEADVYGFGVSINGEQLRANQVTTIDVLTNPNNLIYPCSPFRRWVWEAAPFRDMIFEDWVFWLEAAQNGAKFEPSLTIDYLYNMSPDGAYLSADWAEAEFQVLKIKNALTLK